LPKQQVDGVVEAVHYTRDGQVEWVRVYLRRGKTFTDHLLVNRKSFIEILKAGKKIFSGSRIPLQASTFLLNDLVGIIKNGSSEIIVIGNLKAVRDQLDNVPII
jgi:hypothetical protein